MENIIKFFTAKTEIFKGFGVQNWVFVAVGVALVLLVIVIVSVTKKSKQSASEPKPVEPVIEHIPVETAVNFVAPEKTADAAEPIPPSPFVVDNGKFVVKNDVAPTVITENTQTQSAEIPTVEPVKETTLAPNEEITDDLSLIAEVEPTAVVPTETEATEENSTVEETAVVETVAEEPDVEEIAVEEEQTSVQDPKPVESKGAKGRFDICNSNLGGYKYALSANNGQLLYESREYKSVDSCAEAISKFISAVENADFTVREDKFGNFRFVLKSPTSSTQQFYGESFSQKNACLSNIESVKRFAFNSPVYDATDKDYVIASYQYSLPETLVNDVANKKGAQGKWVIEQTAEDKNSPYEYLLYANNGQLLYQSREYKTLNSCQNGLTTFINTVQNGIFVVNPDKSNRYSFVLRSAKNGSQMTYEGQSYDSKRACESSIESVYKFALLSPTDTL